MPSGLAPDPCASGLTRACRLTPSPAASRRSGTGPSSRRSRARTSRAVSGEIPASRAISRSEASGLSAMSLAAVLRRSAPLTGRTRPSRPTLASEVSNWCPPPVGHARIAATVLAATPLTAAIMRSDHCGYELMIRDAAALRSARDSGRPCRMFAWTASTKELASSPSKNRASTSLSPRDLAARNRCIPSITRMVWRCTIIGGSGPSTPASARTCPRSSPESRGESESSSEPTRTLTTARPSRSPMAGTSEPLV